MKRVFSVSAIRIHYALHTMSPFADAVISEACTMTVRATPARSPDSTDLFGVQLPLGRPIGVSNPQRPTYIRIGESRIYGSVETTLSRRRTGPDLSVWRPWAGSLLQAPTHPQML